ncbi:MAG TPA: urease accessory protein UreF [Beijerinckiaceae bacterium]|jgi:urease accessory protein|nr:urease accessory protein UreF [Beijerinckiaceae bacterium]
MSELQLPLAVWFSPMFPVGAFAYSHGLEWAHEAGDIADAEDLRGWLTTLVERGALQNDAIILAAAYRAALLSDARELVDINELALALATSRERRLETATQGSAFLLAIRKSWPCATLEFLNSEEEIAYPIAVALAAAGHNLPLDATLDMYCLGFISNLVSAAIRLGIIGQTDGQRVIAALMPVVLETARSCASKNLDELGGSAFRSDLASLRHETQYTRLFRS